ncbi:MAG: type II toxin-antitoxin system Phd/YefM family antitoxin [Acidimicrobiales bacterium]|jgi:hypothetical protein
MLTVSALRANIYRILDHVLESGEPIEIERHGRIVRITADDPPSRLANLIARPDAVVGDIGDLDAIGWTETWIPDPS